MGNLFRMNSLFERELSAYPSEFKPSGAVSLRAASMEYLFCVCAHDSDVVLFSEEPDGKFLEEMKEKLSSKMRHSVGWKNEFSGLSLKEWGNFYSVSDGKFIPDEKKIEKSRYLNSKFVQMLWKGSDIPMEICRTEDDLKNFALEYGYPFAAKEPLSFSGTGNRIFYSEKDLNRYNIDFYKGFLLEKWVERTEDVSGIFNSDESGIRILDVTYMMIDHKGGYNGNLILSGEFPELSSVLLKKTEDLFWRTEIDYHGPFSVDCFSYRAKDGIKFHYFSEFNFRYSFGRIHSDLRRKRRFKGDSLLLFFKPEDISEEIIRKRFRENGKYSKADLILLSPAEIRGHSLKNIPVYIELT